MQCPTLLPSSPQYIQCPVATGQHGTNSLSLPLASVCDTLPAVGAWMGKRRKKTDRQMAAQTQAYLGRCVTGVRGAGPHPDVTIRSGRIPDGCQSFCFTPCFLFYVTQTQLLLGQRLGVLLCSPSHKLLPCHGGIPCLPGVQMGAGPSTHVVPV